MGSLQTTPPPELEVDVVVTDVEAVVVVMTDDEVELTKPCKYYC